MAKDKASFVLYSDLVHTVDRLSDARAGRLLKIILHYVNDKNPDEPTDQILLVAFEPIKQQLKRDLVKWRGETERRSDAGKKGMESRWKGHVKVDSKRESITEDNSVISAITKITNITDNVSVNVSDSVSVKRERGTFVPPPLDDVIHEMTKKLDDFTAMGEAQKFINHYSSNGWKVGKNKMIDWRAAVRGWIGRMPNYSDEKSIQLSRIAAAKKQLEEIGDQPV